MAKRYGGVQTNFDGAVCPLPGGHGDSTHGGTRNGYDVTGGEKGTAGVMPEVTTVEVAGSPKIGGKVGVGGVVANKKD